MTASTRPSSAARYGLQERGVVLGDEPRFLGGARSGVERAEPLAVEDLHRGRAAHHRDLGASATRRRGRCRCRASP